MQKLARYGTCTVLLVLVIALIPLVLVAALIGFLICGIVEISSELLMEIDDAGLCEMWNCLVEAIAKCAGELREWFLFYELEL